MANSGTISGTDTDGIGISAGTVNVTGNTGTISGGFAAIEFFDNADITNLNLITGERFGIFSALGTSKVANSGTISGTGTDGIGISAATVNVTSNTGTISGGLAGVGATKADIANSNLITGGDFGIVADEDAKVANSGTISATGKSGVAISAATANVTNSRRGTISGNIAIQASGAGRR